MTGSHLPFLVASMGCFAALAQADDWPPALDSTNTTTQTKDGRTIERYTHGPREAWGYPESASGEWSKPPDQETGVAQQNHDCFYVVAPKQPRENAPLCVVLHSANRTAYDYLGFACLGRQIENREDPTTVMTNSPDDFYSLYLNSTNAEWWGWSQARQNSARNINIPTPAERRVLDTIEWVVKQHKIDRNRIYLCGVSMGGCGTLGLGMPHGDVFAAIRADVPAGTGYASARMGGFAPSPAPDAPQGERDAWLLRAAGVGLPDPPVICDFSSQTDTWSITQPALSAGRAGGAFAIGVELGTIRACDLRFVDREVSHLRCRAGFSVAGDSQERSVSGVHPCLMRSALSVAERARGIRQHRPDQRLFPMEERARYAGRICHATLDCAS